MEAFDEQCENHSRGCGKHDHPDKRVIMIAGSGGAAVFMILIRILIQDREFC